jgi:hypothetical protein
MKETSKPDLGRTALTAGVIGNLLAIANSASILLLAAPGSEIRPMHVPVYLLMIAIGTTLCSIPAAIAGIFQTRRIGRGVAGIVLGLTPLFVGLAAFFAIVHFFGYKLQE